VKVSPKWVGEKSMMRNLSGPFTPRWIWAHSDRTIPIPGFKNVKQATENARAMEFGPMTETQMEEIDAILGLKESGRELPKKRPGDKPGR
jgi:diketogulonate reductase-like aldo/keto reductase